MDLKGHTHNYGCFDQNFESLSTSEPNSSVVTSFFPFVAQGQTKSSFSLFFLSYLLWSLEEGDLNEASSRENFKLSGVNHPSLLLRKPIILLVYSLYLILILDVSMFPTFYVAFC